MSLSITPRPYQQEAIDSINKFFIERRGNPVVVAPTGAGKSIILAGYISQCFDINPNVKIMVLAHVKELLVQNHGAITKLAPSVYAGIYSAGLNRRNIMAPVIVAGIQSVAKKANMFGHTNIVIVDECFSGDTEILTSNGFKRFDELTGSELVAQVDTQSKKVTFVVPNRIVNKPRQSEMINLSSDTYGDWLITGGHQMLIERFGNTKKIELRNLKKNNYTKLFSAGYASGDDFKLSPLEKFYIAFQADGNLHKVNKNGTSLAYFSFSKERKIRRFTALMNAIGYSWCEISCKTDHNKTRRRFSVKLPFVISKDMPQYFDLGSMSLRKARKIISYANMWDGHVASKNTWLITNTNKVVADFYQAVCSIAGMHTKMTHVIDNRSDNFSDVYRLFIRKNDNKFGTQNMAKKEIEYDGNVYCVSVPDGNIIVRRGGNVMITGNCHLINQKSMGIYRKFIDDLREINPKLKVVGLTATPFRLGHGWIHKGDDALFDDISYEIKIEELIEMGFLVNPICKDTGIHADLSNVHIRKGEYVESEATVAFDLITDQAVQDVLIRSVNRKCGIVFCQSVAHAKSVVQAFKAYGEDSVVLVTGNTKADKRDQVVEDIKAGKIKWLINVAVFTTGFDAPNIDVVVLLRATQSTVLYIQTIGRGLRPHPDKDDCLVLDYGDNVKRHGPLNDIQVREKSDRKGQVERVMAKICPKCENLVSIYLRVCNSPSGPVDDSGKPTMCGYEFPYEERGINHDTEASELELITKVDPKQPNWRAVKDVTYNVHRKIAANLLGREDVPTMRVTYTLENGQLVNEWVCLEHYGYAYKKAAKWMEQRGYFGQRMSVVEGTMYPWPRPNHILIKKKDNGFFEVMDYNFNEEYQLELNEVMPMNL